MPIINNLRFMRISLLIFSLIAICSCSTRNLVYFSDLPQNIIGTEKVANVLDPLIQPSDYISVRVNTLNSETNLLFNSGVISNTGGSSGTGGAGSLSSEGYRVDKDGAINFPILGRVMLGGLTIDEATDTLTSLLEKEAKNPIVNLRILNFKITVLGEVSSPGTFNVSTENINIIEAIGLAGDLTPFGKRENVLLIRVRDGVRTSARLDLNKKDVFSSPYFYLQQNDLIYVEPVRARAAQASMSRSNISLAFSIISIATLLLTRFVFTE